MATLPIIIKAKGAKSATKAIKGVTGSVTGLLKSAGPMIAAFVGVQKAIQGVTASVKMAGEMQTVAPAFEGLTQAAGMSGQAFDKFSEAINGTMGKVELMKMSNEMMMLGVANSEDEMARLMDTAQRLAAAVGQDAAYGIDSLSKGIGRQSKLMLDNLGIMVDTGKAYEDHAKKINKKVSALTDEEKKQAFTNAALEEADKLVKSLGDEQETQQMKMDRAKASLQDFGLKLGQSLQPAINLGIDLFDNLVNKLDFVLDFFNKIDITATLKRLIENWKIYNNMVAEVFGAVWDYLPELIKAGLDKIIPIMKGVFNRAVDLLKKVGQFIFEPLTIGAKIIWEKIKEDFEIGGANITNAFNRAINKMVDAYNYFAGSRAGRFAGMKKMKRKDLIDIDDIKAGYDETIKGLQDQFNNTKLMKALLGKDEISNVQDFKEKLEEISDKYKDQFLVYKETKDKIESEGSPEIDVDLTGDTSDLETKVPTLWDRLISKVKEYSAGIKEGNDEIQTNGQVAEEMFKQFSAGANMALSQAGAASDAMKERIETELATQQEADQALYESEKEIAEAQLEQDLLDVEARSLAEIEKMKASDVYMKASEKKKLLLLASVEEENRVRKLASDRKNKKRLDDIEAEKIAREEKTKKQFAAQQTKIAKFEKASNIATAIIQGVGAVIKTFNTFGFPWGIAPAAVMAGLVATQVGNMMATPIPSFSTGGEFMTNGDQLIRVGDNPSGKEHVKITPLNSAGQGASSKPTIVNVTFNNPIMTEDFTEGTIIPQIKDSIRKGEDMGIMENVQSDVQDMIDNSITDNNQNIGF